MLIDKTHTRWCIASGFMLLVATALYCTVGRDPVLGARGGSVSGLLFGIVGSLFMVFAGLLGARRPLRILRLGSARFWMKGHLWLGTLSVPFILFHSGFGLGGWLEQLLWICLGLVVASGFFGLLLQQILPRVLGSTVQHETVSDERFVARRLTLLADANAREAWGQIEVTANDYEPLIRKLLSIKGFKKVRDAIDVVPEDRDFLTKVLNGLGECEHVKLGGRSGVREDKLPGCLAHIYGIQEASESKEEKSRAQKSGESGESSAAKKSPLEQMREKAAAAKSSESGESSAAKKSPLEQMREKAAAAKSGESGEAPAAKKSPLEQMREKAAAAKSGKSGEASAAKKSPLEQMREKAAAAKSGESGESSVAKKSPLEQMREKAAAAKSGKSGEASAAKKSPLEQMREKAAAAKSGESGESSAAKKSPLEQMREKAAAAKSGESGESSAAKKSPLEQMREKAGGKGAGDSQPLAPAGKRPPVMASVTRTASPKTITEDDQVKQEVLRVYLESVRPFLSEPRKAAGRDKFRKDGGAVLQWMRMIVAADLSRQAIDQITEYCEERRKLDLQCQIKAWMQGWLLIHIPVTVALAVFFVAHVFFALRVLPPFSGS